MLVDSRGTTHLWHVRHIVLFDSVIIMGLQSWNLVVVNGLSELTATGSVTIILHPNLVPSQIVLI
jgi:hypothetical protein